jgi:hypothetical protein
MAVDIEQQRQRIAMNWIKKNPILFAFVIMPGVVAVAWSLYTYKQGANSAQ